MAPNGVIFAGLVPFVANCILDGSSTGSWWMWEIDMLQKVKQLKANHIWWNLRILYSSLFILLNSMEWNLGAPWCSAIIPSVWRSYIFKCISAHDASLQLFAAQNEDETQKKQLLEFAGRIISQHTVEEEPISCVFLSWLHSGKHKLPKSWVLQVILHVRAVCKCALFPKRNVVHCPATWSMHGQYWILFGPHCFICFHQCQWGAIHKRSTWINQFGWTHCWWNMVQKLLQPSISASFGTCFIVSI